MIAHLPLTFVALIAAAGIALAHPLDGASSQPIGPMELEIIQFRQAIVDAVKAKDAARLREIYADGFTHTHGSGKVDGKDTRIVAVLAGDPSIEMAPADELSIRAFGADTAIVTGRSPILNVRENRDYDFRWIAVYVRVAGEWRLAASQATLRRLPDACPESRAWCRPSIALTRAGARRHSRYPTHKGGVRRTPPCAPGAAPANCSR